MEASVPAPETTRRATAPDQLQEMLHDAMHVPALVEAPKLAPLMHISEGETQAYRHLAHSIVSRTLALETEYHRMKRPELGQRDWKLLKRHNDLSIYKRRTIKQPGQPEQTRAPAQAKRPMVLCVGSITGKIEEILYGINAKTRDEMQATLAHMSKGYMDCALLAKLEGGSDADPYRQLALKWHLSDTLGDARVVNHRDLCTLESMGFGRDALGERYAYYLLQSVDFAGCPAPPETSDTVRANMMMCCIFRQVPGSPSVDVYVKGMFDLGGDIPSFLMFNASSNRLYPILQQGRKKQFINKKTAQHFHVVHRSQRDPKANDPEASKYVLLSSTQQGVELRSDSEYEDSDDEMPDLVDTPAPKGENSLKPTGKESKPAFPVRKVRFGSVEAEDLVDENGLPRDGYDYSQHMKEMGHGKFYSATSRFDASEESRAMSRHVELPKDALPSGEEQERLLDAITLTTDVMDEDLREALVNDSAFEELDDNFVLQAAEEKEAEGATDDFDYDAHIAKLMEAASGVPKFRGNLTDSEDEDEFSDDDSEELSDDGGEVETPQERDEAQRVLDELFEKTLAEEYDDEQLGELEEDDPETRGEETLDGALLEAVIEDYAAVQQELADAEGKLGNPLRTGNRLQQVLEECEAERRAYEEDENATTEEEEEQVEEDLVARAEREEKEIQELYERNKYLQREEREQWDCETIVSTYSTLDNHPTVLREEAPRRKKKKQVVAITTAVNEDIRTQKVTLSRKTGMPLGVFETAAPTHNKGFKAVKESVQDNRRQKGETKEEKRARKAAVKMEKMARRAEKKETKLAFKEEEARQSTQTVAGRVSVFKY
ncbi:Protein ltv1 [Phytophthora boehmeriae]|uniref:Protein ltv1 n=1 Tax=Phytophthora boehmeriae TaxID=109152 RepID=A0A8T1W7K8_9STRA|nr:Protein ltv1 [Phytophthora boehmeriae]